MRRLPNAPARQKQYQAIHYVIHYSGLGRMDAARAWLKRALRIYPHLSDYQIYRLKMRFDDFFLRSAGVNVEHHNHEGEFMMERLTRKMGGR